MATQTRKRRRAPEPEPEEQDDEEEPEASEDEDQDEDGSPAFDLRIESDLIILEVPRGEQASDLLRRAADFVEDL